jgi:hypothetical protein
MMVAQWAGWRAALMGYSWVVRMVVKTVYLMVDDSVELRAGQWVVLKVAQKVASMVDKLAARRV